MRLRTLVIAAAFVGFAGVGTLLARGTACGMGKVCCVEHHACCDQGGSCCPAASDKQWSIVNLLKPVLVNRTLVSGPLLIVHDDEKMQRGEPCTTFYRFDQEKGPKEALVSFHCTPRRTTAATQTTLTTAATDTGVAKLVEYQLAGETEAHGVPR